MRNAHARPGKTVGNPFPKTLQPRTRQQMAQENLVVPEKSRFRPVNHTNRRESD